MKRFIIWVVMVLFLAGCSKVQPQETSTPYLGQFQPTQTLVSTPVPNSPPPIQPTKNPELSETGPWLVYDKYQNLSLIVRNVDGYGHREILIPEEATILCGYTHPGHCAVAPVGGRTSTFTANHESGMLELRVSTLPQLETEILIPLATEEAMEYSIEQDLPETISLLGDYGLMLWSPDGRYLAFVSTINFPGQSVHIYDSVDGSSELVFESDQWLMLTAWSENSEHIVFQTRKAGNYPVRGGSLYSFSFSTRETTYFGAVIDRAWKVIPIGWVSEDRLVVYSAVWEDEPRDLRLIDVANKKAVKLANPLIGSAAVDPLSGSIIFEIGDFPFQDKPRNEKDLKIIKSSTLEVTSFPLRGYAPIEWFPTLQLFGAKNSDNYILFDNTGKIFMEFSNASEILPSPDGKNMLVFTDDGLILFSSEGNEVNEFPRTFKKETVWLPNSQTFFAIHGGTPGDLFRYSADNQWQAELIDSGIDNTFIILIPD